MGKERGALSTFAFCDCVQEQLREARIFLHIQMIMKRLQVLEDYFKDFDGKFDKNGVGYDCRGESETVEKNVDLRRLRVFRTPYGKKNFLAGILILQEIFRKEFTNISPFLPKNVQK